MKHSLHKATSLNHRRKRRFAYLSKFALHHWLKQRCFTGETMSLSFNRDCDKGLVSPVKRNSYEARSGHDGSIGGYAVCLLSATLPFYQKWWCFTGETISQFLSGDYYLRFVSPVKQRFRRVRLRNQRSKQNAPFGAFLLWAIKLGDQI